MNINRSKKIKKNVFESKIFLGAILFLAVILLNSSYKMYKRSVEVKKYLEASKSEFSSLEEQYKSAYDDLEYLKSNTGSEKEIRAKFDLAREGEKAVFIIEGEKLEIQEPQKKSFWKKIKDWASF